MSTISFILNYSNNNQILGAPKTTNFIEKATWGLAAAMIVLSVISVAFLHEGTNNDSVLQQNAIEQAATNPNNVPGMVQPSAEAPAETSAEAPASQAQPTENSDPNVLVGMDALMDFMGGN